MTRTLGTLIASGVPILEGLLISRDTSGNHVFERAFDNIYTAIREGETIAVPLREARIVDDMVVNMVDVICASVSVRGGVGVLRVCVCVRGGMSVSYTSSSSM